MATAAATYQSRVSPARGAPGLLSLHVPTALLDQYRALFNGARAGEEALVRSLLAQGVSVNLRGPRGATPLHIAARFGQAAMVDLLLAHGADASLRDDRGATPFDKAQAAGLIAVTTRLQPPNGAMSPRRSQTSGAAAALESPAGSASDVFADARSPSTPAAGVSSRPPSVATPRARGLSGRSLASSASLAREERRRCTWRRGTPPGCDATPAAAARRCQCA